jgi:hypothetical protein
MSFTSVNRTRLCVRAGDLEAVSALHHSVAGLRVISERDH